MEFFFFLIDHMEMLKRRLKVLFKFGTWVGCLATNLKGTNQNLRCFMEHLLPVTQNLLLVTENLLLKINEKTCDRC